MKSKKKLSISNFLSFFIITFITITSLIMVFIIIIEIKKDYEWHQKCNYQYIDLLGNQGTASRCSATRGSIVCDGSVQVVKFWGVCDGQ